jgi:hypothetical protein
MVEIKRGFNMGLVSKEKRICLILIPKCGLSTLSLALLKSDGGFEIDMVDNIENLEQYEKIAVVRDPLKRWVSAIGQYIAVRAFTTKKHDHLKYLGSKAKIDNVFNIIHFDKHTLPQTEYLCNAGEVTLFDIDNLEALRLWLLGRNIEVQFTHENTSAELPIKVAVTELLTAELKHAPYTEKILKFYKEDVDMYNAALLK